MARMKTTKPIFKFTKDSKFKRKTLLSKTKNKKKKSKKKGSKKKGGKK
jgi:hypothetical protein